MEVSDSTVSLKKPSNTEGGISSQNVFAIV
jgi:hypothetical protein